MSVTHLTPIYPHSHTALHKTHSLTDEVVGTEEVVVPDLQSEARRHVDLRLCQTVEVLFLLDDHDLLGREVLEREHHSPVEVSLSVH